MYNIKFVYFLLAITFASSYAYSAAAAKSKDVSIKNEESYHGGSIMKIEDRHNSAILGVMESMVKILQTFLAFADGRAKIDDIVATIQEAFKSVQILVNVKTIVSEVPFIGPYVAIILSPMLNIMSMLMQNSPLFGGLLSQLLIGPDYPVELPTTTTTTTTTPASFLWG